MHIVFIQLCTAQNMSEQQGALYVCNVCVNIYIYACIFRCLYAQNHTYIPGMQLCMAQHIPELQEASYVCVCVYMYACMCMCVHVQNPHIHTWYAALYGTAHARAAGS
jgi:hypothetical protein